MILSCTCKHQFQDEKYGKQNRVMCPTMKGYDQTAKSYTTFRCTVCSKERSKK